MKKGINWIVLAAIFLFLTGCGKEADTKGNQVYYLTIESTKIIPDTVQLDSELTAEEQVKALLECLQKEPHDSKFRRTIPENIKVSSKVKDYQVILDFSEEYNLLSPTEEILVRAAIVRTLTQVEGISYVTFLVDHQPLMNKDGSLVGSLSAESFVENTGEQINAKTDTTLTLYFANEKGTGLKRCTLHVPYSSNISMEKLVMAKLIEGPKESGYQATLPSGTKMITSSVVDGVCYINFDETFRNNQNNEIAEQVVLYSIVNSLTELSTVDKVQISINGDTSGKLRYNYDLFTMYEMDETLVEGEEVRSTEHSVSK